MYRLIFVCCVVSGAFLKHTETYHEHRKIRKSTFTKCLLKTGAEISLPSDYTWWCDSQGYHTAVLKHSITVAYAESKSQVQELVKCASKHKIKINPRSGGQSYEAFGNEDDHLVVDVSRINSVKINKRQLEDGSRTAMVGAGVRLGVLYYELGRQQFAFPAGICPAIGLAGHVGAGGFGLLSRVWGLAADNVLELEVVTASGKSIVANNETNVDLFFALRGGGGGNYGIVTKMKLKIYPNPPISTAFIITWNQRISIPDFSKAFFKWKPWVSMPREMSAVFVTGEMNYIEGIYIGEDGHEGLENILNASGFLELGPKGGMKYKYHTSTDLLEVRAWMDNGGVHYGNESDYEIYNVPSSFIYTSLNLPPYPTPVHPAWVQIQKDPRVNATHLDDSSVGFKRPMPNLKPSLFGHDYSKYSGQLITKEFDEAANQAIEQLLRQNSTVMLYPTGGKINEYPTDFNGHPFRNVLAYMQTNISYQQGEPHGPSGVDKQRSINAEIQTAMQPYTNNGSYQGTVDLFWTTDPKIYMPRYYAGNVGRLVKTKAKYDPDNLFSYQQRTPTKL